MGKTRIERELLCPECDERLSVYPRIEDNGQISIIVTCESCDYEGLVIKTGFKEKDLKKFSKPLKHSMTREMKIVSE